MSRGPEITFLRDVEPLQTARAMSPIGHVRLKHAGCIERCLLLKEFQSRGMLVRAYYYTATIVDQEFASIRPLIDWLDYNGYPHLLDERGMDRPRP